MKRKVGKALVVGAGISGIRTALDLAEVGYGVTLIDRSPHMGGILSQLDYQFPSDHCGMCKMLPLVDRDASSQYCLRKGLFHENIEILLSTELSSVEGDPGNFKVRLKQKSSWVDPDLCIGCNVCVDVCPVEVDDTFNAGLCSRKPIYLPIPHAIPNPYVIDISACTRCGKCEKACPTGAIRLSEQERKKLHILVVDDEKIIRDSLKEWLDDEGFSVDTAESGADALDKLSKHPYQLMLLDIKMPGMDGVEVLQKAKDILPELQVVMMTAYATVETAVEAMKIGALDYLIKPFDPEILIPKVLRIYEDIEASSGRQIEVGSIVLSGGTSYFDPSTGKNTLGYKEIPGVVTSIEYERIMSNTGPSDGKLIRPNDGKPLRKIAWIQCIGSRDLQTNADFCSNICCMYSIKEALLTKEKSKGEIETAIFYMDMRTFGKSYQRYREEAETKHGVRFERSRVHSIIADNPNSKNRGDLSIHYVDSSGEIHDEEFDMVVLAVGQRPVTGTDEVSKLLDISLNPWGFCQTEPFSMTRTDQEGILLGGAYSGLKDISESVIQASAAALSASRIIHSTGGSLALEPMTRPDQTTLSRDFPRILIVICTCGETLSDLINNEILINHLKSDPMVSNIEFMERTCTASGWESLTELISKHQPNRVLIGACLPYLYAQKIRELSQQYGLDPSLVDVVDIRSSAFTSGDQERDKDKKDIAIMIESAIATGLAKLKHVNPSPVPSVKIIQQALVVGGGIAGMTTALAIADHGFQVDLIEQDKQLGGNLTWLKSTLDGHSIKTLLDETLMKIEKHPMVNIYPGSKVIGSYGQVGHFYTTIENEEGEVTNFEHGVVVLATGGSEAVTTSFEYGNSKSIITQKELEQQLENQTIDPGKIESAVMIQCVDSRQEPRNYCSRICCASAIKHALDLKEKNPEIAIYILYRDIMTYGFTETYFTQARKAGVIFIQYDPENKPTVHFPEESDNMGKAVQVDAYDPILGQKVRIDADLVVLATGVVPDLPSGLAESFGASIDKDGFFQEAESKWRPVDSLKEGIFSCGLAHSPRTIEEAITTAEAAAQRSLRILSHKHLPASKIVATVHHTLCSLCERCIDVCPYGARVIDSELEEVIVNPVMCQGCGSCAAVCPNSASVLEGFKEEQMLEIIDAALEGL